MTKTTKRQPDKLIMQAWISYRDTVLSPDCSDVQLRETFQAFFAGAAMLYHTVMISLAPGVEPTQEDILMMEDIAKEIDAFGAQLDKEILKPTVN